MKGSPNVYGAGQISDEEPMISYPLTYPINMADHNGLNREYDER